MRPSGTGLARRIHRLNPIDTFERQSRILLASELNRGRPVTGGREEQPARVSTELRFLLQPVAGIGAVGAGRENSSLTRLDRLPRLLVGDNDSIEDGLERSGRCRIYRDAKSVIIRPEAELERFGSATAAHEHADEQQHQRQTAKYHA